MQAELGFPQPLSEKYRPARIADFVGLDKVRKVLSRFVQQPFPSTWLFVGPSGTGKTTMGLALAGELPAEVHHIPSRNCDLATVESVAAQCYFSPRQPDNWKPVRFHLVLVDEADQMSYAAQLAFLSKLDATEFPPNTIFIFTCNSTENLERRFLSRCRTLEFSSYGLSEGITSLLQRVWDSEMDGPVNPPNFARITKESNNNVRDALMNLELAIMAA